MDSTQSTQSKEAAGSSDLLEEAPHVLHTDTAEGLNAVGGHTALDERHPASDSSHRGNHRVLMVVSLWLAIFVLGVVGTIFIYSRNSSQVSRTNPARGGHKHLPTADDDDDGDMAQSPKEPRQQRATLQGIASGPARCADALPVAAPLEPTAAPGPPTPSVETAMLLLAPELSAEPAQELSAEPAPESAPDPQGAVAPASNSSPAPPPLLGLTQAEPGTAERELEMEQQRRSFATTEPLGPTRRTLTSQRTLNADEVELEGGLSGRPAISQSGLRPAAPPNWKAKPGGTGSSVQSRAEASELHHIGREEIQSGLRKKDWHSDLD
jgi:hypothetical protein